MNHKAPENRHGFQDLNQLYDMELAERFHLKRKLECKTFEWYLTYIYPELEIPKGIVLNTLHANIPSHLLHNIDYVTYESKNDRSLYERSDKSSETRRECGTCSIVRS